MILYDYFRSSASYRVRLALAIKGIVYEKIPISLLESEHRTEHFLNKNPQGLVPILVDDTFVLTQSLAICEYLDEAYPETYPLLPSHPKDRAQVRAMSQLIACDVHPLNNLRVLQYLEQHLHVSKDHKQAWYAHWVVTGFNALEEILQSTSGIWAWGDHLGLVDVCLQPQIYNAHRFSIPLDSYPRIKSLADAYMHHPLLQDAYPK